MSADARISPYEISFFEGSSHVAVMEVYSDASENSGHFSIGSLLFRKKNIRPFNKKWRAMLRKHGIDHFHMTDCNVQKGEFKGKSRDECDACAREAISILLEFAIKGSIFSVKMSDFYEVIGERGVMPNPFTLGAWHTIFDIRYWADQNDPVARISYIFEAGDEHQKDVNSLFRGVREDPDRTANARYRNHAFVPKELSYPAQAADILAWHGAKHQHRKERDKDKFRLRGDFNAIITKLHVTDGNHGRAWLQKLAEIGNEHMPSSEVAGLAFRAHSGNRLQIARRVAEIIVEDPEVAKRIAALANARQNGRA
jgi:hypothetical protein